MDFHAVVQLVGLLCLVHLRLSLAVLVLGVAGRYDQGRIYDRALAHRDASLAEMSFDCVKNLVAKPVLLQKVTDVENRRFIRGFFHPTTRSLRTAAWWSPRSGLLPLPSR